MFRNIQDRTDVSATITSLTAEAAVLEERIRVLREELAAVSARTGATADALRRAERAAVRSAGGEGGGDRGRAVRRAASGVQGRGGSATR